MDQVVIFVLLPLGLGLSLALLHRERGSRSLWIGAGLAALLAAGALLVWMAPFAESSPVTAVMWGSIPPLLVAGTVQLTSRLRRHWLAGALIGATIASASLMPIFLGSCIVADMVLPRSGCFF